MVGHDGQKIHHSRQGDPQQYGQWEGSVGQQQSEDTLAVRATPSCIANGNVLSDKNKVDLTDRRHVVAVRAIPSSMANGRIPSDNIDVDLTDRYRATPSRGVLSDNNDVRGFRRTTTTRIGECSCDAKGRRHVERQTDHGSVTGRSELGFLLPSVRGGDGGGEEGGKGTGENKGAEGGGAELRQIACDT